MSTPNPPSPLVQRAQPAHHEQVASLDQIARVSSARLDGGAADGMRVIDVAMLDGLTFQVLPDRGLDIGAAWCASPSGRLVPISWTSRLGAHLPPLDTPVHRDWITRFTGGLLTTCGIDNVGPTSEGVGLHGSWSHRRAHDVIAERTVNKDGSVTVSVRGIIDDANALDRHIRIHRTITTQTGRASITIDDTIENLGPNAEPVLALYHCNFGYPFWSEGSTVTFADGTTTTPRDADAAADLNTTDFPGTGVGRHERVYEQTVPTRTDEPGALATISSPSTGLVVEMSWSQKTLPRCIQWIHPGAGVSALGIEPSNSSVKGRAHDRAEDRLHVLAPGETEHFMVEIAVADISVVDISVDISVANR
jgi:Domain of unknown function (DUF4432)